MDGTLTDQVLLAQCEVDKYRASGPGGQKRNKTDSAVRLRHIPTGIIVIAEESRSQIKNRAQALRRLRKALALRIRRQLPTDRVPESIRAIVTRNGRIRVGQRDERYLPAAGVMLDLLAAH